MIRAGGDSDRDRHDRGRDGSARDMSRSANLRLDLLRLRLRLRPGRHAPRLPQVPGAVSGCGPLYANVVGQVGGGLTIRRAQTPGDTWRQTGIRIA